MGTVLRFCRTFRLSAAAVTVALGGLVLAACSEPVQTEFTADNESGFMQACTEPIEDAPLVSSICQCVFEQIDAQLDFTEFSATDEELMASPDLALPQEITDMIARCVIDEAEL